MMNSSDIKDLPSDIKIEAMKLWAIFMMVAMLCISIETQTGVIMGVSMFLFAAIQGWRLHRAVEKDRSAMTQMLDETKALQEHAKSVVIEYQAAIQRLREMNGTGYREMGQ